MMLPFFWMKFHKFHLFWTLLIFFSGSVSLLTTGNLFNQDPNPEM